ncbi:MAG: SPOR domain-containing protein [Marinibacterium sp.]
MKLTIPAAGLVISTMLWSSAVAQGGGGAAGPAEVPPDWFAGSSFVDSRGCVFVRAEVNGRTDWAPQVTADRRPVCGRRPTFAEAAPGPAPLPVPTPDAAPRADTTVSAAPPAKRSEPVAVVVTPPVRAAVGGQDRPAQRASHAKPSPRQTTQPSATRFIPRHVYEQRAPGAGVTLPKGYRPVWQDDRLNRQRAVHTEAPAEILAPRLPKGYRPVWADGRLNDKRGVGSEAGAVAMARLWTDEVPRQTRAQGDVPPGVAAGSRVIQSPDTLGWASVLGIAIKPGKAKPGTAKPAAKASLTGRDGGHYVRVAAYGSDDAARQAAGTIAGDVGLPTRPGRTRMAGKETPVVLAGPFASRQGAQAAMRALRKAGFRSARIVR